MACDGMIELPPAELQLLEKLRAFVEDRVKPHAAAWERGQGASRDVLPHAARLGLLGLQVPAARGGMGLSFTCKLRAAELIAAADFGLSMSLVNTQNVADDLARGAAPEVSNRHVPELLSGRRSGCTALTEPGAGSDFAAIETAADAVADGWRLDGRKTWITNGAHAEVIVAYAQTKPGSGAAGIAAFVVDAGRPGFERDPAIDMDAVRSIGTGGFRLEAYRCRHDEMLYPPGLAFKNALNSINGARAYVAAMCCGMVGESLRVASAYGLRRKTFGKSLHQHQGWRWGLADAAIDLDAARLLVDAAARQIDAGRDAQGAAARAKIFATRMAQKHIAALLHAMGAEGLRDEYPLMRHVAAAQLAGLVDGSTEMLLERVARDLGRP
jgi:alkylation response protein AidB-like acyl-CoA dehydrogenase